VRDDLGGRQAVLWGTSSAASKFECEDVPPDNAMRPYLPEGSRRVLQAEYLPIYSLTPGKALYARLVFFVRPEAGQEGVAEADKMWRMAGDDEDNYGDHASFFRLALHGDVTEAQLASFIRGSLQGGCA
jgi:hypothetical protein